MRWLIALALTACACPSKQSATRTTGGTGTTTGSGTPTGCDAITAKVQALYRAEAQGAEKGGADPRRVEEAVSDNTAMVAAVCLRDPGTVSTCVAGVTTVKDLEAKCLPKLDEEGSEADALAN
jgi:hypothetical protein